MASAVALGPASATLPGPAADAEVEVAQSRGVPFVASVRLERHPLVPPLDLSSLAAFRDDDEIPPISRAGGRCRGGRLALRGRGHSDATGDYKWKSPDGHEEAILRLRPDGQWWHAAHVATLEQRGGSGEEVASWEIAEALGSWRQAPLAFDDVEAQDGSGVSMGVLLSCESIRWASGGCSTGRTLRPPTNEEADLYATVNDGRLVLCYILGLCAESGHLCLDLEEADADADEEVSDITGAIVLGRHARRDWGIDNGTPRPVASVGGDLVAGLRAWLFSL